MLAVFSKGIVSTLGVSFSIKIGQGMNLELPNKSVLYVAYHYPPILGSSGVHRSLAFSRYLSEYGWHTKVLTASLKGYDHWSPQQLDFIPPKVEVIRAFCRNAATDLSIKGKYLSWMALPDNWQSWIVGGVISGLMAIKKQRPDVIVSTYPIASAHIIAYILHRMTGVKWVADFRDPMAQADYPTDPTKKRIFQWIEKKVVAHCSHVILTAPGALALYQARFPDTKEGFWQLINNGYDKIIFEQIEQELKSIPEHEIAKKSGFVLLHSGVIYPSERDPSHFFAAIAALKQANKIDASLLEIRLRATGHDHLYQPTLERLGINDIVKLVPAVTYKEALDEMYKIDGLLLMQAANCNYQIPAKAYEYIRVQKPILGLMPSEGDTGQLLQQAGVTSLAPLDDSSKIEQTLLRYIEQLAENNFSVMNEDEINQYSRQYQAVRFEQLLSQVITAKDSEV